MNRCNHLGTLGLRQWVDAMSTECCWSVDSSEGSVDADIVSVESYWSTTQQTVVFRGKVQSNIKTLSIASKWFKGCTQLKATKKLSTYVSPTSQTSPLSFDSIWVNHWIAVKSIPCPYHRHEKFLLFPSIDLGQSIHLERRVLRFADPCNLRQRYVDRPDSCHQSLRWLWIEFSLVRHMSLAMHCEDFSPSWLYSNWHFYSLLDCHAPPFGVSFEGTNPSGSPLPSSSQLRPQAITAVM